MAGSTLRISSVTRTVKNDKKMPCSITAGRKGEISIRNTEKANLKNITKRECEKELKGYPAALTAKETAQILRVSVKTVYKLIKENKLPAVKVGRELRIAKSLLAEYLWQTRKSLAQSPKNNRREKTKMRWTFELPCGIVRSENSTNNH